MKLAVPVKDESLEVFLKTGQAPYFAIFENDKFSHLIKNLIEDEEEKSDKFDHIAFHKKQVELLEGIDVILVILIGKHIKEALRGKNIQIIEFPQNTYKNAIKLVKAYMSKNK